jgi:hypothetical protein
VKTYVSIAPMWVNSFLLLKPTLGGLEYKSLNFASRLAGQALRERDVSVSTTFDTFSTKSILCNSVSTSPSPASLERVGGCHTKRNVIFIDDTCNMLNRITKRTSE